MFNTFSIKLIFSFSFKVYECYIVYHRFPLALQFLPPKELCGLGLRWHNDFYHWTEYSFLSSIRNRKRQKRDFLFILHQMIRLPLWTFNQFLRQFHFGFWLFLFCWVYVSLATNDNQVFYANTTHTHILFLSYWRELRMKMNILSHKRSGALRVYFLYHCIIFLTNKKKFISGFLFHILFIFHSVENDIVNETYNSLDSYRSFSGSDPTYYSLCMEKPSY